MSLFIYTHLDLGVVEFKRCWFHDVPRDLKWVNYVQFNMEPLEAFGLYSKVSAAKAAVRHYQDQHPGEEGPVEQIIYGLKRYPFSMIFTAYFPLKTQINGKKIDRRTAVDFMHSLLSGQKIHCQVDLLAERYGDGFRLLIRLQRVETVPEPEAVENRGKPISLQQAVAIINRYVFPNAVVKYAEMPEQYIFDTWPVRYGGYDLKVMKKTGLAGVFCLEWDHPFPYKWKRLPYEPHSLNYAQLVKYDQDPEHWRYDG